MVMGGVEDVDLVVGLFSMYRFWFGQIRILDKGKEQRGSYEDKCEMRDVRLGNLVIQEDGNLDLGWVKEVFNFVLVF